MHKFPSFVALFRFVPETAATMERRAAFAYPEVTTSSRLSFGGRWTDCERRIGQDSRRRLVMPTSAVFPAMLASNKMGEWLQKISSLYSPSAAVSNWEMEPNEVDFEDVLPFYET